MYNPGPTLNLLFVPPFPYPQNGHKNNVYPHKALMGTKMYLTKSYVIFIISTPYIVPMIIISFYSDPISPVIFQYKSSNSV